MTKNHWIIEESVPQKNYRVTIRYNAETKNGKTQDICEYAIQSINAVDAVSDALIEFFEETSHMGWLDLNIDCVEFV